MLETNIRQADYYESRFEAVTLGLGANERAANRPTRVWTRLRRRIQRLRSAAGVDGELLNLHRMWLGDLTGARVLDLGCFTGNRLSLSMAAQAAEYVGVDLSDHAISELNGTLQAHGLLNARAVAMDFLNNNWPDGYFDVIYAYSVLHHFSDIDIALVELRRVLKPGGVIISMDPLATDPFNRLARFAYRPFQTDRDWEFPFTGNTLSSFRRHFEILAVQGLGGAVKLAYPMLLIPTLEPIGRRLAERLRAWDFRRGSSFGVPLNMCWHITMKLRRPVDDTKVC